MKVALVQTNPTIGDVDGNVAAVVARVDEARRAGAALAVFPEQAILGYPAKDLLLRREVIARNVEAIEHLRPHSQNIGILVGYAEPNDAAHGRPVFNSAALLAEGRIAARWRKRLLPTYDVFDEAPLFRAGRAATRDRIRRTKTGRDDLRRRAFREYARPATVRLRSRFGPGRGAGRHVD